MIKEKNGEAYLELLINDGFLLGQLELYKIEFANTGNNKYLEVMNQMNKTIECFNYLRDRVDKLQREVNQLKKK